VRLRQAVKNAKNFGCWFLESLDICKRRSSSKQVQRLYRSTKFPVQKKSHRRQFKIRLLRKRRQRTGANQ
jgi:hypothetical protein